MNGLKAIQFKHPVYWPTADAGGRTQVIFADQIAEARAEDSWLFVRDRHGFWSKWPACDVECITGTEPMRASTAK